MNAVALQYYSPITEIMSTSKLDEPAGCSTDVAGGHGHPVLPRRAPTSSELSAAQTLKVAHPSIRVDVAWFTDRR
jgi:hypothetical protein